jgi:hypothetical protein
VRHIKTALIEEPDLAVWELAFTAICSDRFNLGQNDRSWRADFDYAIRPEKRGKWLDEARANRRAIGQPRNALRLRRGHAPSPAARNPRARRAWFRSVAARLKS